MRERLLPHETAFCVLYAITIARLGIAHADIAMILAWLGLLCLSMGGVALTHYVEKPWAWRVRLGLYLVIMNLAYVAMGPTVSALHLSLQDAKLARIDTVLFGEPLPMYFDGHTSKLATEILSGCYFLLFPYIVISCVRYLWWVQRHFAISQRFYAGVFSAYAIAFIGYQLVPAEGPWLAMPQAFHDVLTGWWITGLNHDLVMKGTNHVDVYPSLHVAASTVMLFLDRQFAKWRFRLYLFPAIGLWIATIYLRYHYGIDVLSGFALAVICLIIAFRFAPTPVH